MFGCFWRFTGFLDVFRHRLLFYACLVGFRDFCLGCRVLSLPFVTGSIHSRSGDHFLVGVAASGVLCFGGFICGFSLDFGRW